MRKTNYSLHRTESHLGLLIGRLEIDGRTELIFSTEIKSRYKYVIIEYIEAVLLFELHQRRVDVPQSEMQLRVVVIGSADGLGQDVHGIFGSKKLKKNRCFFIGLHFPTD